MQATHTQPVSDAFIRELRRIDSGRGMERLERPWGIILRDFRARRMIGLEWDGTIVPDRRVLRHH